MGEHACGVLIGTLTRAKGLEFKEVFIPGLVVAEWPSRWLVPPDLPDEPRQERVALQRRTLFVGMTRGRDPLTLLSGGAPAATAGGRELGDGRLRVLASDESRGLSDTRREI